LLRQSTSKRYRPTGAAAATALSALSGWLHYTADVETAEALRQLQRLHNVAPPPADTAVAEAYELLDRFDALDAFCLWSATETGRLGYWPHLANVA